MKKILSLFITVITVGQAFAGWTNFTFTFDSKVRAYTLYVPDSYNADVPATLIVALHGLGGSMTDIMGTGISAIADTANIIVASPQALDFASPVGVIESAWNNGIAVTVTGFGEIVVNEDVDDIGFINAMMDSVQLHYNINAERNYLCGMSMGGFMTQRLACASTNRFAAAASLAGTYALALPECAPSKQIPVAHFHGTADDVITYEGFTTFPVLGDVAVGLSVDHLISKWTTLNDCSTTPDVVNVPDANADGLSLDHYIYSNASGKAMVELFRINGGLHLWYDNVLTGGEFDYATEVWKFFNKQYHTTSINNIANIIQAQVYPNPATNIISINAPYEITDAVITDITGKVVASQKVNANKIAVDNLAAGMYLLKVATAKGYGIAKFVKQ